MGGMSIDGLCSFVTVRKVLALMVLSISVGSSSEYQSSRVQLALAFGRVVLCQKRSKP